MTLPDAVAGHIKTQLRGESPSVSLSEAELAALEVKTVATSLATSPARPDCRTEDRLNRLARKAALRILARWRGWRRPAWRRNPDRRPKVDCKRRRIERYQGPAVRCDPSGSPRRQQAPDGRRIGSRRRSSHRRKSRAHSGCGSAASHFTGEPCCRGRGLTGCRRQRTLEGAPV